MRHPLSERFHELLRECGEMHDRKQQDYGREHDPFFNVRTSSEWGMPAWVGAMMRLNDKVKRLQALANGSELANEGAADSFIDIAVYALIAYILFEEDATAGRAESPESDQSDPPAAAVASVLDSQSWVQPRYEIPTRFDPEAVRTMRDVVSSWPHTGVEHIEAPEWRSEVSVPDIKGEDVQ